jgi:hypothetical protein
MAFKPYKLIVSCKQDISLHPEYPEHDCIENLKQIENHIHVYCTICAMVFSILPLQRMYL